MIHRDMAPPFGGLALDAGAGGPSRSLPDFPNFPPAGWLVIATWVTGISAFAALLAASAGPWLFQPWSRFVDIPAALIYASGRPSAEAIP